MSWIFLESILHGLDSVRRDLGGSCVIFQQYAEPYVIPIYHIIICII